MSVGLLECLCNFIMSAEHFSLRYLSHPLEET